MVILDTDFLSSFFKIRKLDLILKALNVKHIAIPSTVYEELKEAKFFPEISSLFSFTEEELNDNRFILVKTINLVEWNENITKEDRITFGKGELGCFILAKKSNETILIDDQRARTIAKEKGLKVTSIPSFLIFCKQKNITSSNEMNEIINELKQKDYYELSEETKKRLLE